MIQLKSFQYSYKNAIAPLFTDLTLSIPSRSRVLVVGANGTGKSTLLRILSGTQMCEKETIAISGHHPFFDLNTEIKRVWLGGEFDLSLDLSVRELLGNQESDYDQELLNVLEISLDWRMHQVSEGQRRRVQLLLGLKSEVDLALLDEVTAQLDVVTRSDFLSWLKEKSTKRTTILYATHIFDGLVRPGQFWPTHILWLGFQGRYRFSDWQSISAEVEAVGGLGAWIEKWIREQRIK